MNQMSEQNEEGREGRKEKEGRRAEASWTLCALHIRQAEE